MILLLTIIAITFSGCFNSNLTCEGKILLLKPLEDELIVKVGFFRNTTSYKQKNFNNKLDCNTLIEMQIDKRQKDTKTIFRDGVIEVSKNFFFIKDTSIASIKRIVINSKSDEAKIKLNLKNNGITSLYYTAFTDTLIKKIIVKNGSIIVPKNFPSVH